MLLPSRSSSPNGAIRAEIESRTRIAERKKLNKSIFVIFVVVDVVVVDVVVAVYDDDVVVVVAIFLPSMSETNCLPMSILDFFLNIFFRSTRKLSAKVMRAKFNSIFTKCETRLNQEHSVGWKKQKFPFYSKTLMLKWFLQNNYYKLNHLSWNYLQKISVKILGII